MNEPKAKGRCRIRITPVLSPADAQPGERIEHGELILDVDDAQKQLNAQHHSYKVLETRRVPGPFQPAAMTEVKDFALSKSDKEGPYIVNIPPGVPHSFQNLDDEVAELVVIFPTNVWEYDVLDYFPFSTPAAKAMAEEARGTKTQSQGK